MNTLTQAVARIAVCVLVIHLATGATAIVKPAMAQEDDTLAIINDYQLRMSDVNALIATMPLGDQVSIRADPEKFAESLIQEEVLFQFALKDSAENDLELREELKELIVNHLIDKFVTQKVVVSDAEIEEFYNSNTSAIRGETVQVSHILTETKEECTALYDRLEQGESFAELATQYSIHERSAANGGVLGSMMNHDGPLGFEQELFEIPENEYTIYESSEGCHIVVITGRETPPLPPLENVKPGIENLLKREKEIEALQTLIERAHSSIEVVRPGASDESPEETREETQEG